MSFQTSASRPAERAFHCSEPGCHAKYVRKEHLNRHRRQHLQETQAICQHCGHSFSRGDLLLRHLRLYHIDVEVYRSRALQACNYCHSRKTRCNGGRPCSACTERRIECSFSRNSEPSRDANLPSGITISEPANFIRQSQVREQNTRQIADVSHSSEESISEGQIDLWEMFLEYQQQYISRRDPNPSDPMEDFPTAERSPGIDLSTDPNVQHYLDVYFATFHPQWPLLHKTSFRVEGEPQLLILSMVMIGLWMSGEPEARSAAELIHEKSVLLLHEQKDRWDMPSAAKKGDDYIWPLSIYQSILLHVVFSMFRFDADNPSSDSKQRLPPQHVHELLTEAIKSCLRNDVFLYPRMLKQYARLGFAFSVWVPVEEVKRLALLLFRVCDACYGRNAPLSRSDLRFPLPESHWLWEAADIRNFIIRRDEEARRDGEIRTEEDFWVSNLENGIELSWQKLGIS